MREKFLKELFDLCDRYKLGGVICMSQGEVPTLDDNSAIVLQVIVPMTPLELRTVDVAVMDYGSTVK